VITVDVLQTLGVGHGAQLTGEVLVVVGGAVFAVLELQFGLEPHAETVEVDLLHTARAFAHGEEWVVHVVEFVEADAAGHAVVFVKWFEHFTIEVVFVK
jgi:hypothetical protein